MSRPYLIVTAAVAALLSSTAPASAGDIGAIANGNWNSVNTWSGGTIPGLSDNAFIGSTTPAGALATAVVSLIQDTTAGSVYLGHDTGTSGTLALGDSTFTASTLYYGFVGTGAITRGAGHFHVTTFDIRHGSFTPALSDVITNIVTVSNGSSFSVGQNLSLSDYLNLQDAGTTFDAQGHSLTATNQILLGWNGNGNPTLLNRGAVTTVNLNVRNQNFQLTSADSVSTFTLANGTTNLTSGAAVNGLFLQSGAIGSIAATSNVVQRIGVQSGSSLTLSAPLNLTDYLDIRDTNTVVNAQGNALTATNQILLGWNGTGNPTLSNRGTITTANLNVRNQNFQLTSADAVGTFTLATGTTNLASGAAVNGLFLQTNAVGTIAVASNVVQRIGVESGSSLTLSAPLNLTDYLDIRDSGTVVNMQGNAITATNQILYGWNGTGAPSLQNFGAVSTGHWLQANGVQAVMTSGADSIGQLSLHNNSRLTVAPAAGVATGLTIAGTGLSALDITTGGDLRLGNAGATNGWVLRWKNPDSTHDHIADINSLVVAGLIDFTNGGTYGLSSPGDGYTYVMTPVPEPSFLLALAAGPIGYGVFRQRRRGS
jgi:hypothetical protein